MKTLTQLLFIASFVMVTLCAVAPCQAQQSADKSAPPPTMDQERPFKLNDSALGTATLGVWSAGTLLGSPLVLTAISDDISLGEASLLSLTNMLGVGALGGGFAAMGIGGAMAVIGGLGYMLTLGNWDDAAAFAGSGLAIAGVGALSTFVIAPLIFGLNASVVDGSLGERPDNLFFPTLSLFLGSAAGGIGGYYMGKLLTKENTFLMVLSTVGTSLLVGNLAYALTREAFDSDEESAAPPMMVATPLFVF